MDNKLFSLLPNLLFTLALGYYLITNLQWYNYKLSRVIFKHKKQLWHLLYFLLPLLAYYLAQSLLPLPFSLLYLLYLPALYLWYKKLDKPLVFTPRIKRFFGFLLFGIFLQDALCLGWERCSIFGAILPLLFALLSSFLFEKFLFFSFLKQAKKKLSQMENLRIVAITASYGKTSIKNFLYQILNPHFQTYMTPRSVNTLAGLVRDVNEELPQKSEIYIAEAGARVSGDILEISQFLEQHYAIVGSIGPQHIEYFGSLENIRNTKMEILNSPRLQKALVHESAHVNPDHRVTLFGKNIRNIQATLEGLSFEVSLDESWQTFSTPLLGAFHAINLTASIMIAKELGVSTQDIQHAIQNLSPVAHRLEKIEAGGKLIIDDSFNGNYEGMASSYDLVKSHKGRKILITPGIIESDEDSNRQLARIMDEVFDKVIITGSVNAEILDQEIQKAQKVMLKDKSQMEVVLAKETQAGDLILFSNDAPTFI